MIVPPMTLASIPRTLAEPNDCRCGHELQLRIGHRELSQTPNGETMTE